MNELRRLEKSAREYEVLLMQYPQKARENQQEYSKSISVLLQTVETYIKSETTAFKIWTDLSVEIFTSPENNIFQTVKRKINMAIVNYFLNKVSYNLSKAGIILRGLKKMQHRFMQFQYFK